MPLASCVRCNKMFNKIHAPVCPACMPDEDADQEKIRAVLAEHNDLKPEAVAESAGVDLAVVNRMVHDGLVAQISGLEKAVCGKCGAPAISMAKKLCEACLDKLNTEVGMAQAKIKLAQKKAPEIGGYINVRKAFEDKRK